MSLEAAQRWMHEALVFPRRGADGIGQWLAGTGRLDPAGGLSVYQRGYFLRIAHCMREQFPALCHALETPLFDDFVAQYIEQHPPESHTLYDLGRRFPAFLEESRPDRDLPPEERESWIDFMIELARFERQVFVLFDAPGHEGKPFADAATPDERLRLQPAFALGAYRYPVAAYYHAVRQQEAAPLPGPAPTFVALVRTDYVTRTIALTAPRHRFLSAMADGASVEAAIAAVAASLGVSAAEVQQGWQEAVRQPWIEWGFFIDGSV
jgi:hypothetical protein